MGNIRVAAFCTSILLAISACGGSGSGSGPGLAPPPPPSPPPPPVTPSIDVQQVFPALSFSSPVSLQQAPGDSTTWYVVEQAGRVLAFANDQAANSTITYLDIRDRVVSGGEQGLLGLAFDPAFPVVEDVYLSYTGADIDGNLFSVLSRFALLPSGGGLSPSSEEGILVAPQDFTNHNGGNIAFGSDGYLYLGLGDGGSGNDPNDRAQDTTNLLGAMVRIDIDTGSPYAIPTGEDGNPFATNATCPLGFATGGEACPEIFAWGLRNPWRFSFDRQTGQLWAGDVGQGAWEEVDRIAVGDNLGWKIREGAHCRPPTTDCDTTGLVDPVTEYDRSLGSSITGGFVYRGSAMPDLVGWYVFGDFVSGRIFAVTADSPIGTAPTELLDTEINIASFAEDNDGELYIVDYGGSIWQITNAP
jgi:glucose/arabinose dehydrogenase